MIEFLSSKQISLHILAIILFSSFSFSIRFSVYYYNNNPIYPNVIIDRIRICRVEIVVKLKGLFCSMYRVLNRLTLGYFFLNYSQNSSEHKNDAKIYSNFIFREYKKNYGTASEQSINTLVYCVHGKNSKTCCERVDLNEIDSKWRQSLTCMKS